MKSTMGITLLLLRRRRQQLTAVLWKVVNEGEKTNLWRYRLAALPDPLSASSLSCNMKAKDEELFCSGALLSRLTRLQVTDYVLSWFGIGICEWQWEVNEYAVVNYYGVTVTLNSRLSFVVVVVTRDPKGWEIREWWTLTVRVNDAAPSLVLVLALSVALIFAASKKRDERRWGETNPSYDDSRG